ncbi:MAG TPA: DNA primase, partial [Actinomycetota bacterium]|nr:DNA primase [Actinomycetota bacterium]
MSGRIRQEDVETVRERTDIVQVVGQYLQLRKAGADRFVGLCPFHTEKTASFGVSPSKQLYHCFGCGVGGNVFHFVMAIENLGFPEAVERLAKQAGITLRYEGLSESDRRDLSRRGALHRANQLAAELYHANLMESPEAGAARDFLASRGLAREAAVEFGIGLAPGLPDFLLRRLAGKLSAEILVEAGLVVKDARGALRDRFRGRVTFPLHDLTGRGVGFGARLLAGEGPKYVNTPETAIYKKGELLYNLHRAKAAMARTGTAVVVEGYTDVIALAQGGVGTAVATCGTALSESHFRLLSRFAERAVLAFDSDEAGAKAAERAFAFHEQHPVEAVVLVLPEGLDPADFVLKHGAGAFEEL